MKNCFKCNEEKEMSEFYKHSQMKDGHLNKCKSCTKKDAKNTRLESLEYYRDYDRARGNRQSKKYMKDYREKYPNKYKAHTMIGNAIRGNRLFKETCSVCGNKEVHAHHDDYLKPLNVRWLCPVHHSQWHVENGEGKNP